MAYRGELKELYEFGCMEKARVEYEALLDTYIQANNVITQGRPKDLRIGVHMCRGNLKVILSQPNNLEFC